MTHRTLAIAVGLSAAVAWSTPSFIAQERVDPDINAKIRKEATGNSKILHTMHYLTDVYGPRADRFAQPEGCGRMGHQGNGVVGLRQRPSRAVGLRPSRLGERAGCRGRISRRSRTRWSSKCWRGRRARTARSRRKPFNMVLPTQPTKDELAKYFESVKDNVKGAHRPRRQVARRAGEPRRRQPSARRTMWRAGRYNGTPAGGGRDGRGGRGRGDLPTPREGAMPAAELNTRLNEFLRRERRKLRINDAAASTGRSAPSTTAPTTSPRRCRPS